MTVPTPADEWAIQRLLDTFAAALGRSDLEALHTTWAPDAHLDIPGLDEPVTHLGAVEA